MFIPDKTKTNIVDASGMMENWPLNQLPYRASDGTIKGSGLRIQTNGNLLAPVGFSVESGSVDFGDVIRLSESAGFLAFENMVDGVKYQLLDYAVPRDAASSKPYYFKLASAEYKFEANSGTSNTITTNPLTFQYTTKLTARTNALIFKATQKMTNFRLRITDKKSGIAIKYFPSKSVWLDASGGTTFDVGDNVVDFQDTAVIFSANTDIVFDIQADNMALAGGSIPYFAGMVQQGSFVGVASSIDIAKLQAEIDQQGSSFNGAYSSLVGVPTTFLPSPHTHVVGDIQGLSTQLTGLSSAISTKLDSSSIIDVSKVSGLSQLLANKSDASSVTQALSIKADASSISTVGKTNNYNDLTNKPVIPVNVSQLNNDSGYITASQVPQQSVSWSSITGKPSTFPPSAHQHTIADVSGLQAALNSKLDASGSISYNSLTDKPVIPTVNYPVTSVAGKTGAVVLAVADVSGLQSSLATKLDASSTISYNSLSDKPTIPVVNYPVTSVSGKTGAVVLSTSDVSGLAAVATTGAYSSLTGTPVIPPAQVNSDWNSNSGVSQILNKPSIPSTVAQLSDASSYAKKTDINYPVNSVNGKTGNVVLSAADVSAAALVHTHQISDVSGLPSLLTSKADASALPIVRRIDNSLVPKSKVKYYRVTSDATSAIWTVNLGTDFTELLDVQVIAESTSSLIGGIRQVSINAFTSTSTVLTGMTFGSNTITTILIGGSQGLALMPGTAVRVRAEGVGN